MPLPSCQLVQNMVLSELSYGGPRAGGNPWCNMGKCNVSICEQEGGAVGGVAEGLGVIWASVICPSVNRREEK